MAKKNSEWTEVELLPHYERALNHLDEFQKAADQYGLPVTVLIGIASRESRVQPDTLGDAGHGHGMMQIDDRSHAGWLKVNDWKNAAANIAYGAKVLFDAFNYVHKRVGMIPNLTVENQLQVAIACYNAGFNVLRSVAAGKDIDQRTAGNDYSKDVLKRAAYFERLLNGRKNSEKAG